MDLKHFYTQSALYTGYDKLQQRLHDYVQGQLGEAASLGNFTDEEKQKFEQAWKQNRGPLDEAIDAVATQLHDKWHISQEEGKAQASALADAMRDDFCTAFQQEDAAWNALHHPDKMNRDKVDEILHATDVASSTPVYMALCALKDGEKNAAKLDTSDEVSMKFLGRVIKKTLLSYHNAGRPHKAVGPVNAAGAGSQGGIEMIRRYYEGRLKPAYEEYLGPAK